MPNIGYYSMCFSIIPLDNHDEYIFLYGVSSPDMFSFTKFITYGILNSIKN